MTNYVAILTGGTVGCISWISFLKVFVFNGERGRRETAGEKLVKAMRNQTQKARVSLDFVQEKKTIFLAFLFLEGP